jgi:hypothetical protein
MRHGTRSWIAVIVGVTAMGGCAAPALASQPLQAKACGARIKASFRLANDLTCTGDALVVRKSGITIDLNGKTIEGDGGDGDNGVDNSGGFDNVIIMSAAGRPRATIRNFDHAVKLEGGAQANTIKRLVISETLSHAIDIEGGTGHRVISNRVTQAGKNGILVQGNEAFVKGNTTNDNGHSGIYLWGNDGVLRANRATDNAWSGLDVKGRRHKVITAVVSGNGLNGIGVAGRYNHVTDSTVRNNQVTGIHVLGLSNEIRDTTVCGTVSLDHIVDAGTSTILAGNDVDDVCGP